MRTIGRYLTIHLTTSTLIQKLANMQPDNPLCPLGVRVAFALGLPCQGNRDSTILFRVC